MNNDAKKNQTDTTNVRKDRPGVIAPPPLIYLVVFVIGYFVQRQFPFVWPEHISWDIAGYILVGLSLINALLGMLTMKRAGTHIDVYKASTAIVSTGPFSFSRNPLYLSLTAMYIGVALVKSLMWPLALLPLALIVMQFGVIHREERYLAKKFGDEYLLYKAKVRRWV